MLKKIALTITILLTLVLAGCEKQSDIEIVYEVKNDFTFETLEVSEDIIIPSSENEDVQVVWTSSRPEYLDIDGSVTRPISGAGDMEVVLTVTITLNDAVAQKSFTFTVLDEEAQFNTMYTDQLTMDFSYESTNFVSDGIGEVDLVSCVDGDTAIFTEGSGTFSVRFLGINTPESTYKFEPWGKPASAFTCDKLTNATTIVLEYDANTTRTDGNERYLAWVWYDGRLLNLEIVEEAYSGSKGVGGLKYEEVFYNAEFKTQDTKMRIWGEDDPSFDYSLDGIQVTIEELVTNQEEYIGKTVVVRGTISRVLNGHPYIQQDGYGIYVYTGFENVEDLIVEGNKILIQGVKLTYYPDSDTGAAQLSNFSRSNVIKISDDNVVDPVVYAIDELSRDSVGSLVRINGLTVVDIYENTNDDAFTVTAEDSEGNQITIRRDKGANDNLTGDLFTVGTTFDVVAPLSRYNGSYQLMLITVDDVTFNQNE